MFKYQTWHQTNSNALRQEAKISHVQIGVDQINASSDQNGASGEEHDSINQRNSRQNDITRKIGHTVDIPNTSMHRRNHTFVRSPTFADWKPPDLTRVGSTFADFSGKDINQLPPLRYSLDKKLFANVHCSWQSRSADLEASYSPRSSSAISSNMEPFASQNVSGNKPKLNTLRPTLDSVLSSRPINVKDLLYYSYNTSSPN